MILKRKNFKLSILEAMVEVHVQMKQICPHQQITNDNTPVFRVGTPRGKSYKETSLIPMMEVYQQKPLVKVRCII